MAWIVAVLAYGGFLAWYQNWRGPLHRDEIDRHMRRLEELDIATPAERADIRRFLEEDDGREFHMLNLVRLHRDRVAHPTTGELQTPRRLLQGYTSSFVRRLIRRAGHPALLAVPIGPYVDTWGVPAPEERWTLVGMMSYRSRRDMIALVASEGFAAAHVFKHAAMPATCSFPMGRVRFVAGPRVVVGLGLALLAALAY